MEIVEVIDSAMKIGLGALISSTATYLTLRRQKKHEKLSDLLNYKRGIIMEFSEKIQISGELSNNITHWVNQEKLLSRDRILADNTKAAEMAKDICNHVSSAYRLSCLIGDSALQQISEKYWINRNDFYKVLNDNDSTNLYTYNQLKQNADILRKDIFNHINHTFFNIHK